jgi:hypothetical protein
VNKAGNQNNKVYIFFICFSFFHFILFCFWVLLGFPDLLVSGWSLCLGLLIEDPCISDIGIWFGPGSTGMKLDSRFPSFIHLMLDHTLFRREAEAAILTLWVLCFASGRHPEHNLAAFAFNLHYKLNLYGKIIFH